MLGRWGTTARQHHDAVAARDLGIDPFQNQHLAIEAYHLAIFDAGIGTRADIGLAQAMMKAGSDRNQRAAGSAILGGVA